MSLHDRHLSFRQVQLLCLVALGLHLLPLILADYAYMDDVWRAQLAGKVQGSADSWSTQGRVLSDWFYAALGFGAAPNLFPLPLLLTAPVAALALARLVLHYFPTPDATSVLVVLPLWFNPFFLQNLSYQYDAPTMALAVAACAWAITLDTQHWRGYLLGCLLVGVALSFYQISINLYAGLCCIEVVRQALGQASFRQTFRHMLLRLGQIVAGCALYYATAYRLITVDRTKLLALDSHWPAEVLRRLGIIAEHVGLLLTADTAWMTTGWITLAVAGLLVGVWRILRGPCSPLERAGLTATLLLPIPLLAVLVPGLLLLLNFFDDGARLLMGLGALLVLFSLLSHRLLVAVHRRLGWLLLIPVAFMLSFSYAYGRVLVAQKELQSLVTFSMAHEIETREALYSASRFYILDIGSSRQWLPAASGSFQTIPALRYVLNINFLVLPEMMPRLGLATFASHPPLTREQVVTADPEPLVRSKFFDIHRLGDDAYVLMKPPRDPESFRQ